MDQETRWHTLRGNHESTDLRYYGSRDPRWLTRYNEVKCFIEENHRNPSKHRLEEHDMLNWLKANRKKMNAGELQEPRLSKFKKLLELIEKNKRLNQYQ